MITYDLVKEHMGFIRLQLIAYLIIVIFAFINFLPRLGVTGSWILPVVSMGPFFLIGWIVFFVRYLVKNR